MPESDWGIGSRGGQGRGKKLIDWIEFREDWNRSAITLDDGRVLTKCDQCREMWAERNQRGIEGDPPCADCIVEQNSENSEAHMIFSVCRYQLIMGMSGPVDMDHGAIYEAMRLYGVRDQRKCFGKMMLLSRWWVGHLNKKAD